MKKNQELSVRSSAAEYLTYITATGDGGVEAVYADENVWLTQKMMGVLYNVGTNTINYHLQKLYKDGEIDKDSVIRKFRITATDGKAYDTMHYNLKAIIAVGNKVDSPKAVQNKLHYAVHGNTAAEVIYNRADAEKEHMGLTSWEGSPESKIHKYDVSIAKNYLTEDELKILTRIVTAYLDFAESMALRNIPMTMKDWEIRLDGFLTLMDHDVLKDKGRISAEEAKLHAETEFEKYRIIQDRLFMSDFDKFLELEESVKDIDEEE